jgi:5'-3' exonuclease
MNDTNKLPRVKIAGENIESSANLSCAGSMRILYRVLKGSAKPDWVPGGGLDISSVCKEPKGWRIFFIGEEMGIPSYFRKITTTYSHIVQRVLPLKANTLCFDFNCLIYRCLQSPTLRPFPGYSADDADLWEDELLKEVAVAVKEVWTSAGSPPNVFIAVDGVVPMAKIRQQRVRRFKSAWLSQQEATVSWDKNAITPGTAFMDKLTVALQGLVKKHGSKWILSSVQEPGEGEHKLLAFLRRSPELAGPVIIYGLDADLILLSMISSEEGKNIWLMRERQEFEGGSQGPEGQQYSFLDIAALKEKVHVTSWITCLNYVTLMSLMGNDFLPHSMTHKLSDDGHSCIMKELLSMKETDAWLVNGTGTLNLAVLKGITGRWACEETERMYRMIEKKGKAQRGALPSNPMEALPLTWNVEKEMLQGKRLRDDWRSVYWSWMNENVNKEHVCKEYVKGIQWILAYYLGKPVDTEWMFPYWIPPLWGDLARLSSLPLESAHSSVPPSPQEQLAMVLPLQSWGLVRDKRLKTLPLLCPQAWPVSFGFFSAGRKWLWECEARIPTLTAGRIRDLLSETK